MTEGDFISLPVYQRVASMPEDDLYIIKMKEITKRTVIAIQKEEPSKSLARKGKNETGEPVDIQKLGTPEILLPRFWKYQNIWYQSVRKSLLHVLPVPQISATMGN
jgi:hypothetical protein